jgi:Immunity protein Imm1
MTGTLETDLYDLYPRGAIVALAGEPAREACGGQLVIGRDRLAWLATPPEGSFPAPSQFRWIAARRYREASDEFGFLPAEVRDRAAPTEQGIEMFFGPEGSNKFIYVGEGSLVTYGFSHSASLGEAEVDLHHKLPEEIWLRLGGYEGWSLSIDEKERLGLSADDVLRLVTAAVAKGAGEVWLTRYEEDSLTLLIEPRRAFVMYLAFPGDSGVTAHDPRMTGSPEKASFTLSNGQVDEFGYEETLPKDDVIAVVDHFLRTGELPRSVAWVAS